MTRLLQIGSLLFALILSDNYRISFAIVLTSCIQYPSQPYEFHITDRTTGVVDVMTRTCGSDYPNNIKYEYFLYEINSACSDVDIVTHLPHNGGLCIEFGDSSPCFPNYTCYPMASASPTTSYPTVRPTVSPSVSLPTLSPTLSYPTKNPTTSPTVSYPTQNPTTAPTAENPTQNPATSEPTRRPSKSPVPRPIILMQSHNDTRDEAYKEEEDEEWQVGVLGWSIIGGFSAVIFCLYVLCSEHMFINPDTDKKTVFSVRNWVVMLVMELTETATMIWSLYEQRTCPYVWVILIGLELQAFTLLLIFYMLPWSHVDGMPEKSASRVVNCMILFDVFTFLCIAYPAFSCLNMMDFANALCGMGTVLGSILLGGAGGYGVWNEKEEKVPDEPTEKIL